MTHHDDFNRDPVKAGHEVFSKPLVDRLKRIDEAVDADLAGGELDRRREQAKQRADQPQTSGPAEGKTITADSPGADQYFGHTNPRRLSMTVIPPFTLPTTPLTGRAPLSGAACTGIDTGDGRDRLSYSLAAWLEAQQQRADARTRQADLERLDTEVRELREQRDQLLNELGELREQCDLLVDEIDRVRKNRLDPVQVAPKAERREMTGSADLPAFISLEWGKTLLTQSLVMAADAATAVLPHAGLFLGCGRPVLDDLSAHRPPQGNRRAYQPRAYAVLREVSPDGEDTPDKYLLIVHLSPDCRRAAVAVHQPGDPYWSQAAGEDNWMWQILQRCSHDPYRPLGERTPWTAMRCCDATSGTILVGHGLARPPVAQGPAAGRYGQPEIPQHPRLVTRNNDVVNCDEGKGNAYKA